MSIMPQNNIKKYVGNKEKQQLFVGNKKQQSFMLNKKQQSFMLNKKQQSFILNKNRFKLTPIQKQSQLKKQQLSIPTNSNNMNNNNNESLKPQLYSNIKNFPNNMLPQSMMINSQYQPQSRMEHSINELIPTMNNRLLSGKTVNQLQTSFNQTNNKPSTNNNQFISADTIKLTQQSTSNRIILDKLNSQNHQLNDNKQQLPSNSPQFFNDNDDQSQPQNKLTCREYLSLFKLKTQKLLSSIPFQILITLLTICSLFMQDIRTLFVDRTNDYFIDYVNLIFLTVFFIEILMSLTVQNYAFSFFFYLDLISTFSICMDVTMFTNLIYNSGGNVQQINMLIAQSKASRAAARAVRIMKIFRLARIVKLYKSAIKTKQLNQQKQKQLLKEKLRQKRRVKLSSGFINQNYQGSEFKLTFTNKSVSHTDNALGQSDYFSSSSKKVYGINDRIVSRREDVLDIADKIHQESQGQEEGSENYKNKSKANFTNGEIQAQSQNIQDQQQQQQGQLLGSNNSLQLQHQQQSRISKILSQSTIKKIIIVILVIMLSSTALDINNYSPDNTSWDFLTKLVGKLLLQKDVSIEYINKMISSNVDYFQTLQVKSSLIAIETPFNELYNLQNVDYNQLRITQIGLSQTKIDVIQILKIRPNLTLNSNFIMSQNSTSLMNSINVIVSYESYNQVESWFSIAKIIFICLTILYLLHSFNTNIQQLIVSPIQKMLQVVVHPDKKVQQDQNQEHNFKQARYQTLIVQKAIVKIRTLMSTIYGKIGMDLIYNQLFKTQTINAKNYISIKKKTYCIYGICKIKNWVEISQILENDAFTFINQIAHIVHGAVFRYGGYGVKNLSDGFLVVFKLPQGKQKQIVQQALKFKMSKQKQNTYLNIFSDFSVFSFIKTIVRIHKEPKLLKYKKDQRILYQFGNNFQVEMSFTLGIGQSIEGMVGSQFKIDPIYLGSKLNQVWKMSLISSKYPNMIIIDKELYENLTVGLRNHCRIMQYVRLSHYDDGNTQIYAVDLDLQYISPSKSKAEKNKKNQQLPDIYLKKQLNMQNLKNPSEISNYSASAFINSKKQLRQVLRKKFSDDMKKKYQAAFNSYIQGDWKEAKSKFQDFMRVIKEDVLCKRIYHFMAERGFKYTPAVPQYKILKDF